MLIITSPSGARHRAIVKARPRPDIFDQVETLRTCAKLPISGSPAGIAGVVFSTQFSFTII